MTPTASESKQLIRRYLQAISGQAKTPGLVAGFVSDPTTFNENYFLEKLHADGTPDTTFAPLGQIVTGFSGFSTAL